MERDCARPQGAPIGAISVNTGRLHVVPVLRLGLPDRRAARRSRAPVLKFVEDACVQCGLCQEHLPGKGDHAHAADRFPRLPCPGPGDQGGRARAMRPMRQAVWRQEHDRSRHGEARRPALDVSGRRQAARCAQDVRRLPGHHHERAAVRSVRRRPRACTAADDRRLFAPSETARTRRAVSAQWATSRSRGPENP